MNNKGFSNGLLAGLIGVIILLVSYFISMDIYLKYASYLVYVAYLYFMYLAGKQAREADGGYISFSKVLGPIFLTYVVGSFIVIVFQYVLINFIDTSILDAMYDQQVQVIERMGNLMGEEALEVALEQLEETGVNFGFKEIALGWGFGLIIPGIIFALIMAAIMKKEDKSGV